MSEIIAAVKEFGNLGIAGLLVYVGWKLLDKWAAQFLLAQQQQASAMVDLAATLKASQGEQREVLLAVRALATQVERLTERIPDRQER